MFSKQAIFAQESPQLQRLTQLAVSNNAELKASVARYQMAKLRFTQVRANPDPMLMIQYQNEGLSLYSFGQTAGSQWMIGLTQEFPLGKLDIKGQMQEAEIELYRINALMVKTKLIAQIKEVNADFYGINQQMKLLLSSKDVLKTMGAIALKQYAEGRETQDNVLMIQLDQYLLEEKYQMQKTKLTEIKSEFMQLCQMQDEDQLATPNELPNTSISTPINRVTDQALQHALGIQEKIVMLKMAEQKAQMSQKESLPDISISGIYSKRAAGMDDMWSLGVTIPLFLNFEAKQSAAIKESNQGIQEASQNVALSMETIKKEITTDMAMLNASERLLSLYNTSILPNAEHLIETTISGYQNGKVMLPMALSRIRNLLDTQMNLISIQVDREKAMARIHAMIALEEVLYEN